MSAKLGRRALAAFAVFALSGAAYAVSPLAAPGDYRLRHDLQVLSDAGVLSGPVQTWPVSWPQVDADLSAFEEAGRLTGYERAALTRVRARLRRRRGGGASLGVELRGGEPQFLRGFADTPRGEAEGGFSVQWTGDRVAGELRVRGVADDPNDDEEFRLDGSWIGGIWGNWMVAAGAIQRHWGPAWQGSLILSNNARPRPGVTLRRMRTEAFESPWLSWLGPWQFTTFVEKLESDRAVPDTLFWGMRAAIRPFESLELGISRTSQFGGKGRDVGFDTVVNVLTGQSTSTNPAVGSADHINQLGGFDARWKLPWVDAALYGELIGEDESGSRPTLFMGQGGVELWGGFAGGDIDWRFVFERADTKADVLDSGEREGAAELGIAYNNGSFPTGYRYRGRVLGHPAEGDATLSSARLLLGLSGGSFFNLAWLRGNLNRQSGRSDRNTLTAENEDVEQLEFEWHRQYRFGRIGFGLGRTSREPVATGSEDTESFGWVEFNRQF